MTTFRDKFHDPRWLDKRDAVLANAGGECENCGSTEELFVHISGFEAGLEPWEYPDEAYRCLCPTHRDQRGKAERDARRLFRAFDEDTLDAICDTLAYVADLPAPKRSVVAEELYVTAKHGLRVDSNEDEDDR